MCFSFFFWKSTHLPMSWTDPFAGDFIGSNIDFDGGPSGDLVSIARNKTKVFQQFLATGEGGAQGFTGFFFYLLGFFYRVFEGRGQGGRSEAKGWTRN